MTVCNKDCLLRLLEVRAQPYVFFHNLNNLIVVVCLFDNVFLSEQMHVMP